MSTSRAALSVVLALITTSCSLPPPAQCKNSGQCNLLTGGLCTTASTGHSWCEYPDQSCPGGTRWSIEAGDDLSSQCVAAFGLSIQRSGNGGGTVYASDHTIECGSTCSHVYQDQALVTLTAEPTVGMKFIGWTNDGEHCGEAASCVVTMTATRSVKATFASLGSAIWATKAAGPGTEEVDSVTVDSEDSVITAGRFDSEELVIGNKSIGRAHLRDGFVAKQSAIDATTRWISGLGCSGSALGVRIANVATDPISGDVYVAGRFDGTCDFPPGAPLISGEFDSYFVARLRGSDGAIIAARRIPIANSPNSPHLFLFVDSEGSVYVAGSFMGSIDFGSGVIRAGNVSTFLVKYDPNAAFSVSWFKTWTATHDANATAVLVDSSNNVVVGGTFFGTLELGPSSNQPTAIVPNMYVVKFSGVDGSFAWVRGYGRPLDSYLYSMALGPSNDIIIAGRLDYREDGTQVVDFGLGPLQGTGTGWEIVLARISTIGELKWARRYGGPGDQLALGVGASGTKVIFGGIFHQSLTVGNQTAQQLASSTANSTDAFAASLSYADGSGTWVERFSSGDVSTVTKGVAVSHNGNAIIIGSFAGVTQFADTDLTSGNGSVDGFCVEIAPN